MKERKRFQCPWVHLGVACGKEYANYNDIYALKHLHEHLKHVCCTGELKNKMLGYAKENEDSEEESAHRDSARYFIEQFQSLFIANIVFHRKYTFTKTLNVIFVLIPHCNCDAERY